MGSAQKIVRPPRSIGASRIWWQPVAFDPLLRFLGAATTTGDHVEKSPSTETPDSRARRPAQGQTEGEAAAAAHTGAGIARRRGSLRCLRRGDILLMHPLLEFLGVKYSARRRGERVEGIVGSEFHSVEAHRGEERGAHLV